MTRNQGPLAVLCLVLFYIGSYFLLMNPRCPAFDLRTGRPTNMAGCRFVRLKEGPGDLTIAVCPVCWLNYVYYPIDWFRVNALRMDAS